MNPKAIDDTNGPAHPSTPKDGESSAVQSTLRGVALSSFLQMMQLEQKTCTLSLNSQGRRGRVFMSDGEVINAETGNSTNPDLIGQDAFRQIMTWDTPDIDLSEGIQKVFRQINLPLMHLLMESQQQIDESSPAGAGKQPSDAFNGASPYEKLCAMLSASSGVTAYEVTDPDGETSREGDLVNDISPMEFISLGDSLSGLVKGRFKYVKINLNDNSSYWAGRISRFGVRVRLKPGFKPGKMMG